MSKFVIVCIYLVSLKTVASDSLLSFDMFGKVSMCKFLLPEKKSYTISMHSAATPNYFLLC